MKFNAHVQKTTQATHSGNQAIKIPAKKSDGVLAGAVQLTDHAIKIPGKKSDGMLTTQTTQSVDRAIAVPGKKSDGMLAGLKEFSDLAFTAPGGTLEEIMAGEIASAIPNPQQGLTGARGKPQVISGKNGNVMGSIGTQGIGTIDSKKI